MFISTDPLFKAFPSFMGIAGASFAENPLAETQPYATSLIADVKIDEFGEVRVIELGETLRSGFSGYDGIAGNQRMMSLVWNTLSSETKLPLWFVRSGADDIAENLAPQDLIRLGGKIADMDKVLKYDPWRKPRSHFDPTKISTYSALLAYDPRDNFESQITYGGNAEFEEYLSKRPWVLRLDAGSAWMFSSEKFLTRTLFEELEPERNPRWTVVSRSSSPDIASEILSKMSSEYYVIKPMDQACGRGVMVVSAEQLKDAISLISSVYIFSKNSPHGKNSCLSDDYLRRKMCDWANMSGSSFIVETFITSDLIDVDNKKYDATGRIVFTVVNGETFVHGGYWKLPASPFGEGSKHEASLSSIHARDTRNSAPFSEGDLCLTGNAVKSFAPRLSRLFRSVSESHIVGALESCAIGNGMRDLSLQITAASIEEPDYTKLVSQLRSSAGNTVFEGSIAACVRIILSAAPLVYELATLSDAYIQARAVEYAVELYKKYSAEERAISSDVVKKALQAWWQNKNRTFDRIPTALLLEATTLMKKFGIVRDSDVDAIYQATFQKDVSSKLSVMSEILKEGKLFQTNWIWASLKTGDPFTSWILYLSRSESFFKDQNDGLSTDSRQKIAALDELWNEPSYEELMLILTGAIDGNFDVNSFQFFFSNLTDNAASFSSLPASSIALFKQIDFLIGNVSKYGERQVMMAISRLIEMEYYGGKILALNGPIEDQG